ARPVRLPDALLVCDGEVGVRAEVPRAARDHARAERAEQHRHVGALDGRQALDVRVDQIGETVHDHAAPRRPERRPGGEGVLRRGDRESCFRLTAASDLGQRLRVDRADVGEGRVAADALAADEMVGRDLDAGDEGHRPDSANASAPMSTTVLPPSTVRTAPLTYDASSESSQAIAPATSSGLQARRSGTCRVASAYAWSGPPARPAIARSPIGVRVQPGQTTFARTPAGPKSSAMHCASITSAVFNEQYATES